MFLVGIELMTVQLSYTLMQFVERCCMMFEFTVFRVGYKCIYKKGMVAFYSVIGCREKCLGKISVAVRRDCLYGCWDAGRLFHGASQ